MLGKAKTCPYTLTWSLNCFDFSHVREDTDVHIYPYMFAEMLWFQSCWRRQRHVHIRLRLSWNVVTSVTFGELTKTWPYTYTSSLKCDFSHVRELTKIIFMSMYLNVFTEMMWPQSRLGNWQRHVHVPIRLHWNVVISVKLGKTKTCTSMYTYVFAEMLWFQ